ncbi:hypothetical protein LTR86_010701 [Recurvomyces mirabilis]|nr:hypothetical protein LTR86_010701 [Recurvomyces mirabilis]
MRILNVYTLEFGEFFDSEVPKYAILSHRWGKHEVSYKGMRKRDKRMPSGAGYDKILNFCRLVRKTTKLEWAWIDTCCIDKSSSAELSEAINSMIRWYRRSAVCYAYLADVDSSSHTPKPLEEQFEQSDWFCRGWTLQELLGPELVIFHDVNWTVIGHKCPVRYDQSKGQYRCQEAEPLCGSPLNSKISRITNIEEDCLDFKSRLNEKTIAHLMSWAAVRRTTRIEDTAYCLMGLFDLNFPPLYGEGDKAFLRLQEELVLRHNDPSVFFWTGDQDVLPQSDLLVMRPMFASQPADFAVGAPNVVEPRWNLSTSFSVSNRGLQWTSLMTVYKIPGTTKELLVVDSADLVDNLKPYALMPHNAEDKEKKLLPTSKVVLFDWGRERFHRVHQLPPEASLDLCSPQTPERRTVLISLRNGQNYRLYTGFPRSNPKLYAVHPVKKSPSDRAVPNQHEEDR